MAPALASYLLSIPLFIHEQTSVPGLVNRILNRLSKKTFEAFPGSFDKSSKIHTVGNPVRPEIIKNPEDKPTIKDHFNILILGGSQGSEQLNEIIIKSFKGKTISSNWRIIHQIGHSDQAPIIELYSAQSFKYEVVPYIENIVLTGHSSGAAFTHLMSSTKESNLYNDVNIEFAVVNNQYFLHPDSIRMLQDGSFSILDNFK